MSKAAYNLIDKRQTGLNKFFYLAAAAALMVLINLLPLPEPLVSPDGLIELTMEGKAALSVLGFVIVLWLTEAMPFPVTALLGLLLAYIFRLAAFGDIVSYGFGSTVTIFFIGVLTLSSGLTRSGLADRFTRLILSKIGLNPRKIIFAFMAMGAFLSMWIVNMSVAAILLPMAVTILKKAGQKPGASNFGRALLIAVAWGSAIGGISTPVGNGANIVALGYLRELAGIPINFLTWMIVGLPAALLILPLAYIILVRVFPPENINQLVNINDPEIPTSAVKLTAGELKALIIFGLAVMFWLGDPLLNYLIGLSIPIEVVAVAAAVAFFLPGINILSWREAQADIDWGGIVLIAAGLSLGMIVFETGAARWLAMISFSPVGSLDLAPRIFFAVLIVELLKVFFSSNTVTGVILIPMMIAFSISLGMNPWYLAGPVAIATSMAFLLVTSSPTNVIPYASGYFTIRDFARAGIFLTLVIPFCITLAFLIFAPLVW
ncbi:MAG: DASS family sodium-coupled anion symporter [Bacillota bacterium]|nr:DASS family sodium-coupled anion symporter [Bacillota bacterium]